MQAGHKHFMATVDLLNVKDAVEKALRELEEGLDFSAVNHMRFAIHRISDAMEKVYRNK